MKAAHIGAMRERVAVFAQTQTVNAAGEITTTWDQSTAFQWGPLTDVTWGDGGELVWNYDSALFATWARVEPMGASAITLANRDDAQRVYRMTIRYRTDITTNSRVIWRDRKFDVEGVLDPTEQRVFLTVMLREINA